MPGSQLGVHPKGVPAGGDEPGEKQAPAHIPPMNVASRTPSDTAEAPITSCSSWNQTTS